PSPNAVCRRRREGRASRRLQHWLATSIVVERDGRRPGFPEPDRARRESQTSSAKQFRTTPEKGSSPVRIGSRFGSQSLLNNTLNETNRWRRDESGRWRCLVRAGSGNLE